MISYDGQIAAFAGARTRHLVPPFDALDPADPRRRMVELMCAFAVACNRGLLPGPYSDAAAARFARTVLIDDEFIARGSEGAGQLAWRFGVPLDEIPRKRHDLMLWRAVPVRHGNGHGARLIRLRPAAQSARRAMLERRSRHRHSCRRGCRCD